MPIPLTLFLRLVELRSRVSTSYRYDLKLESVSSVEDSRVDTPSCHYPDRQ